MALSHSDALPDMQQCEADMVMPQFMCAHGYVYAPLHIHTCLHTCRPAHMLNIIALVPPWLQALI